MTRSVHFASRSLNSFFLIYEMNFASVIFDRAKVYLMLVRAKVPTKNGWVLFLPKWKVFLFFCFSVLFFFFFFFFY
jgi:hypothetical protein